MYKNLQPTQKKMFWLRVGVVAYFTVVFLFLSNSYAFAGNIGGSIFATGTKKLIKDVSGVLTAIIPLSGAVFIGIQTQRKKWADGDGGNVSADANKKIKMALIATIIGTTAFSLITVFMAYYGVAPKESL